MERGNTMTYKNVIYILTNPSFEDYIKIGYADDLDKRLAQLNRSECIPYAFRAYAVYKVDNRLSDLQIHKIIDTINPNLRTIETFQGRRRVREFYAMTAENAYKIFEAIADMHGFSDRLIKIPPTQSDEEAEATAEEIAEERHERMSPFAFSKCNIEVGETVEFYNDPSITCKVISDKTVEYQGKEYSLTALAQELTHSQYNLAGPRFFKYKGEPLNELRKRMDQGV